MPEPLFEVPQPGQQAAAIAANCDVHRAPTAPKPPAVDHA